MNLGDLFRQAKDMQAKAGEIQTRIAAIEVEGESGAGMVRLTLNGKSELKSLTLDPTLAKPDLLTVIQDLVIAAHADAKAKLELRIADAMTEFSREMGLPPGLGGLMGP